MTLDEFYATTQTRKEICHVCEGRGEVDVEIDATPSEATGGMPVLTGTVTCDHCQGTGWISHEEPMS